MHILILFSTMLGTTEKVANVIQKKLNDLGNSTDVCNVYYDPDVDLSVYDVLILGAPTYDDGLEMNMSQYISSHKSHLGSHKIAVFGLGDKLYPAYCTSVNELEEWVVKNKGTLIRPSLKIDGYPVETDFIEEWARDIHYRLSEKT